MSEWPGVQDDVRRKCGMSSWCFKVLEDEAVKEVLMWNDGLRIGRWCKTVGMLLYEDDTVNGRDSSGTTGHYDRNSVQMEAKSKF